MPAEYNAPDCDYWGSDGAWKEAFDSVEDEQKFQWVAESDTGADDELEDAFPGKLLLLLKDWCNLPLPVNMAFTNHRDFQVKVLSMLIDFWGLIPRILIDLLQRSSSAHAPSLSQAHHACWLFRPCSMHACQRA